MILTSKNISKEYLALSVETRISDIYKYCFSHDQWHKCSHLISDLGIVQNIFFQSVIQCFIILKLLSCIFPGFYAGNLDLFISLKFPHVTDDVFFHVTFLRFRIREEERVGHVWLCDFVMSLRSQIQWGLILSHSTPLESSPSSGHHFKDSLWTLIPTGRGVNRREDRVGRMWEGTATAGVLLVFGGRTMERCSGSDTQGLRAMERGHRHHLSLHRHRERGKEGQVLHRSKRGWVWNQFFVIEEYTGPDPVLVGRVSKNKGLLHPFIYILSISLPLYVFLLRLYCEWKSLGFSLQTESLQYPPFVPQKQSVAHLIKGYKLDFLFNNGVVPYGSCIWEMNDLWACRIVTWRTCSMLPFKFPPEPKWRFRFIEWGYFVSGI